MVGLLSPWESQEGALQWFSIVALVCPLDQEEAGGREGGVGSGEGDVIEFPLAHFPVGTASSECNSVSFSRSPQSIVEDIHQGKSEHYGSETLREILKLLPESEEVRNLAR